MSQLFNYGTVGVLVGGKSPLSSAFEALSIVPVEGVQSSSITLTYNRQDTNDWAGAGDPILVQRPRASLEFTYIYSSGINEGNLGFITNGIVPALTALNIEQNYYVLIDQAHQDLIGYNGTNLVTMAFGNGVLNRYQLQAGVGQLTTVTVGVEALNLLIQSSGSGILPSVYNQAGTYPTGTYVLPAFTQQTSGHGAHFESMPASILLSFDTGSAIGAALSGANSCPLQSFNFSIDLTRTDVDQLGWAYPVNRPLHYPINISIHADAYLNGFQLDALNRLGCPDSGWNFTVQFENSCSTLDPFSFYFQGAKLDTETFTMSTQGGSEKVSFNWNLKVYDVNRVSGYNLFMGSPASSTAYTGIIFQQVAYTGAFYPLVINLATGCYLSVVAGSAFFSGNTLFATDQPGTIVIQANVSGATWDYQDITLDVGP